MDDELGRQLAEGCDLVYMEDWQVRTKATRMAIEILVRTASVSDIAEAWPDHDQHVLRTVLAHVRKQPELLERYLALADRKAEETRRRLEPLIAAARKRNQENALRAAASASNRG